MRPEGGVEAAWSSFESKTAARYADPDSDIARQEAEILMITYDLPQKSAEFYSACNAFASSLMRQYGREAIQAASRRLMSGDYRSLDDLFSAMGGLSAAITSWKGDPSVPR
jgi:hypothetical protein